jgi:excisionase family DNA binding protein
MLVSISEAAKMANVSRDTFYRHIDEKKISIKDAGTKRPKVDVSELVRVYGDKLTPLEEIKGRGKIANDTSAPDLSSENALLKEKLQMLEAERERERRQQTEQIEHLRESLEKSQESVSKVTALLSDQRSEAEKRAEQGAEYAQKLTELENQIKAISQQQDNKRKGWRFWGK